MAIVFELPNRNLGLAVLVAVDALGRPEIAGLASAFFLIQLPILLVLALALRRTGRPAALVTRRAPRPPRSQYNDG